MQVFAIWHLAVHRLFQGENSTARPLKPCPPIMTPGIPLNRGQNWKAGEVMPQQTGLLLSVRFLLGLSSIALYYISLLIGFGKYMIK